MMKFTLILAALLSAQAHAAAVPVTVTFSVPSVAYLADTELSRFQQLNNQALEGKLSAPVTAAATSISLTGICPANGTALYIDSEPLLSTAGAGTSTCTVTRNSALSQANTVAAAHASGAQVNELLYSSAQNYFIRVGVQAFLVNVIQSLGTTSAVNGTALSAVATNRATAAAALVGVAQ